MQPPGLRAGECPLSCADCVAAVTPTRVLLPIRALGELSCSPSVEQGKGSRWEGLVNPDQRCSVNCAAVLLASTLPGTRPAELVRLFFASVDEVPPFNGDLGDRLLRLAPLAGVELLVASLSHCGIAGYVQLQSLAITRLQEEVTFLFCDVLPALPPGIRLTAVAFFSPLQGGHFFACVLDDDGEFVVVNDSSVFRIPLERILCGGCRIVGVLCAPPLCGGAPACVDYRILGPLLSAASRDLAWGTVSALSILGVPAFSAAVGALVNANALSRTRLEYYQGNPTQASCSDPFLSLLVAPVIGDVVFPRRAWAPPRRPLLAPLPLIGQRVWHGSSWYDVTDYNLGWCTLRSATGDSFPYIPYNGLLDFSPLCPPLALPAQPSPAPAAPIGRFLSLPAARPSALRVATWNCGGLSLNRANTLPALQDVDILLLQEVWAPSPDTLATLGSFDCFWRLRPVDGPGRGGVGLLVRRGLAQCSLVASPTLSWIEAVIVDIHIGTLETLRLASVYSPPITSTADMQAVEGDVGLLAKTGATLGGDWNAAHALWSPQSQFIENVGACRLGPVLLRAAGCNDLVPVFPVGETQVCGRTLDFFLVQRTCLLLAGKPSVYASALGSDHRPVILTLDSRRPPPSRSFVAWNKVTQHHWSVFTAEVERGALRAFSGSVDARAYVLDSVVHQALTHFPRVHARRSPFRISAHLADLQKAAAVAWRSGDLDLVRAAEGAFRTAALQDLHQRQARAAARCDDPATLWKLWRDTEYLPAQDSVFHTPSGDVRDVRAQLGLFTELYRAKHARSPGQSDPPAPRFSMPPSTTPFSMVELEAALALQRKTGAADPSDFPPQALRHLPRSFKSALLALAQGSIGSGDIPRSWLLSVVVPVPKPGKPPTSVEAFRPVALTSLLCRLVERMVQARMLPRVLQCLDQTQYGFLPHRSCDFPVIHLIHTATEGQRRYRRETNDKARRVQAQEKTVAIAVDFSDAFCRVSKEEVAGRLLEMGVDHYLVRWLHNWLAGRRIKVRWRGRQSAVAALELGVPQGSILGPFLWLVLADSLARSLAKKFSASLSGTGSPLHFGWVADDLTVWTHGHVPADLCRTLRAAMRDIQAWASSRGIKVSSKTDAILLGGDSRAEGHFTVPLSDTIGTTVDGVFVPLMARSVGVAEPFRLLGVWLDSNLTLSGHVDKLEVALEAVLVRLHVVAKYLPPRHLRTLFFGAGMGKLLHGAPAWWPLLSTAVKDRLNRIHASAARIIAGTVTGAALEGCLGEARLLPLSCYLDKACWRRCCSLLAMPDLPVTRAVLSCPPRAPELNGLEVRERRSSLASRFMMLRLRPEGLSRQARIAPYRITSPEGDWGADKVSYRLAPATHRRSTISLLDMKGYNADTLLSLTAERPTALIISDGSVPLAGGGAGSARLRYNDSTGAAVEVWADASAGPCPSSYTAEMTAISAGLSLLLAHRADISCGTHVVFATDSLSSIEAIAAGPLSRRNESSVWQLLRDTLVGQANHFASLTFVQIFAHCGFTDGDSVDARAKACSTTLPHSLVPITPQDATNFLSLPGRRSHVAALREALGATKGQLRLSLLDARKRDDPEQPPEGYFFPFCRELPPSSQRLLAQLRTGVCPRVGGWMHGAADEACVCCGTPSALGREGRAIRHVFACPTFQSLRAQLAITDVTALATAPEVAVQYVQAWLAHKDKLLTSA